MYVAGFSINALPPLLLDLIIWVPITVKMQSYQIQPYRVVKNKGAFYRHQSSVVFTKIDHLNQSQGALNKMFGNRNIHCTHDGQHHVRDCRDDDIQYPAQQEILPEAAGEL